MNTNRVVTIRGKSSEWYEKAVFVIKPEVMQTYIPKDLSKEAERIISNYAKKNGLVTQPSSKKVNRMLNFILGTVICILIICLLQL